MARPPLMHDLTCAIHLHSTYSDGTGTVPQIAAAAARSAVDVVLLTDHDTLAAQEEEGWYGSVLVLVGEEVSPRGRDHTLAFGVDHVVSHRGRSGAEICEAIARGGGIAFAAHPFSAGTRGAFERFGPGAAFRDLDAADLTGIELWSFVTDTAEALTGIREAARFIASPGRFVTGAPERNLAAWDELCRRRRLVAIGGIDAHQVGLRVAGHVPLRLMAYARSFRHLRTHALCEEEPAGELGHDRDEVYSALANGRCYIAMDSLAPARGFCFWADGSGAQTGVMGGEESAGAWTLRARLPRPARWRLLRDGVPVAEDLSSALDHAAAGPGAYRVEARLEGFGRERTWILSNPIYLR